MREALDRSKVFVVERPLDPDLEITRFVGEWIRRHGEQPAFFFRSPKRYPDFPVVMNLFKRSNLLASLRVDEENHLAELGDRMAQSGLRPEPQSALFTRQLRGLSELPALRHQPREPAPYLTSFITCLRQPDHGTINTGFYRTMIQGDRSAVIFMDARTHAHAIVKREWEVRGAVPVTMFVGGSPAHAVVAASNLPDDLDSFEAACRLLQRRVPLFGDGYFPPAPADAEVVIHGHILPKVAPEGPFGEFKGYYCTPTRSPILQVDAVRCRPDAHYLGLFCGKESGLTLMALPNEILMYQSLRQRGFDIQDVRYPLVGLGEFITLIRTPRPRPEIADAALELDRRTKAVVVLEAFDDVLGDLSTFDFGAVATPYIKRQQPHGDRLALVVPRQPQDHVEY